MVSHNALQMLSERATRYVADNTLATEEAVKHALVLPFIQAMGYDCFDPAEVVPEFIADYGMKKGEKVDYALKHQGVLSIIVEVKELHNALSQAEAGQLSRYFANTNARVGVLTNGVRYLFFSDLDDANVMDSAPFLEIDITALDARDIVHLEHFSKRQFNAEEAVSAAANMKFINGMTGYLSQLFASPDEAFVRLMAKSVYGGPLSTRRIDMFTPLVKVACQSYLQDRISVMLHRAAEIAETREDDPEEPVKAGEGEPSIFTTADELAAFDMVVTILTDAEVVMAERVSLRDTKSYCNVLLDDSRLNPICRFRLDGQIKQIGTFDGTRQESGALVEERHALADLSDIMNFAPTIISRVQQMLNAA